MTHPPPRATLFPYTTLFRSGTHARLLGSCVRDGLLTLPAAIHKTTGASAAALGLGDRGVLREGAWADVAVFDPARDRRRPRSEEHTSELQSLRHLVCRLLLE